MKNITKNLLLNIDPIKKNISLINFFLIKKTDLLLLMLKHKLVKYLK